MTTLDEARVFADKLQSCNVVLAGSVTTAARVIRDLIAMVEARTVTDAEVEAVADVFERFHQDSCYPEAMREESLAAARAALQAAERAAWQPIETAPKNSSTDIWIARGNRIAIASWFAKWDYCRGGPYTDCWVQPGGAVFNPSPTHWRPLPTPPTSTAVAMVEASVTDAEVEAAAALMFRTVNDGVRKHVRVALEAAAAARLQTSGTQAKAAQKDGLNREESEA